jgi:hypothetical protein
VVQHCNATLTTIVERHTEHTASLLSANEELLADNDHLQSCIHRYITSLPKMDRGRALVTRREICPN